MRKYTITNSLLALSQQKNHSKTIQQIKSRNYDVINKEDTSASFMPVHSP